MVYDCFIFHNELALLEIRCEELKGIMDSFILGESNHTFSGKEKPYYYEEAKDSFSQYPITRVEIPFISGGPWAMETHSRVCLAQGIPPGADDDVILLSDADEIPSREVLLSAIDFVRSGNPTVTIYHDLSYYYVNSKAGAQWPGTQVTTRKHFIDMTALRGLRSPQLYGGWHFSYCGGVEKVQEKLGSYAHTEYDTPEYLNSEHISKCLSEGSDLFHRVDSYRTIPLDESFPKYLLDNQTKFSSLIKSV